MTTTLQQRPDISVCIANYNGEKYVLECLASVFAQQGDFTLEVLVHDDCSSDRSLHLIRREFPTVTVLTSEDNVGFCISNNRMAMAASGRYFLLLNNDAVLRPSSLQNFLDYADAGNGNSILGLPQHSLVDDTLVDRGYQTDLFLNPIPLFTPGNHQAGVATGACLWIPRTLWVAIGGFPEWFESVAEDIYLCMAARLLGYQVAVLDGPGFDHWIGTSLGGGKIVAQRLNTTVRRRALSERNKTFVMWLCYPLPALFLVGPLHFFFLFVEAIFLLVTGTEGAKVRRIYLPILPALWRRRANIAALRAELMKNRRCTLSMFFSQSKCVPQKIRMLFLYGKPSII